MGIFRRRREYAVDRERIPAHIAIIMDGNGRWARRRGLPRTAGHAAGAETFRTIANFCKDLGVQYLTVYAFSTENWKRPEAEVDSIMGLLERYLQEVIRDAEKNRIHLTVFGDLSALPPALQKLCRYADETTARYEGCQVNLCVNYGGRDEILHAARACARDCAAQGRPADDFTQEELSAHLYSGGIPDPDLIIRPSGEVRISNFLLWQSAYAEFYFTDVLWPEFSTEELLRAIAAYQARSRRFGGV